MRKICEALVSVFGVNYCFILKEFIVFIAFIAFFEELKGTFFCFLVYFWGFKCFCHNFSNFFSRISWYYSCFSMISTTFFLFLFTSDIFWSNFSIIDLLISIFRVIHSDYLLPLQFYWLDFTFMPKLEQSTQMYFTAGETLFLPSWFIFRGDCSKSREKTNHFYAICMIQLSVQIFSSLPPVVPLVAYSCSPVLTFSHLCCKILLLYWQIETISWRHCCLLCCYWPSLFKL